MHPTFYTRAARYAGGITAVLLFSIGLAGCNGSSGSVLGGGLSNAAKVRFVNGSPDSGPVDVFIDNQAQFNTPGTPVAYGSATGYLVNLNAGSHAVIVYTAGNDTASGQLFSGSVSVNGGGIYTVALTGELHPAYTASSNLTLTTFTDQPYNTPGGGAAVNFHNASPYSSTYASGGVQFGYYPSSTPGTNPLGNPIPLGSATNPIGLQSAALNVPITFYAVSPTFGTTTTASQWSSNCSTNAFPCDTGNLSLYLVDGPAASTAPTTLPPNATSTMKGYFIGVFDANGL
jgi:hypothetical protein